MARRRRTRPRRPPKPASPRSARTARARSGRRCPASFYRAPQPGAPPFVEVGDRVAPDTVVGIIETMKLMTLGAAPAVPASHRGDRRRRTAPGRRRDRPDAGEAGRSHDPPPLHRQSRRDRAADHPHRAAARASTTILGVSEADRTALPARWPTRPRCIGPARSAASYLLDRPHDRRRGCGAGRRDPSRLRLPLGECRLCRAPRATAGIIFVGPDVSSLDAMGDKLKARGHRVEAGLPVVPGGEAEDKAAARDRAASTGYPLLLKAVAGGGGRGMKRVDSADDLDRQIDLAMAEARAAFGDPRIYVERFIGRGRHVEVQVLGDGRPRHPSRRPATARSSAAIRSWSRRRPAPGIPEPPLRAMTDAAVAARPSICAIAVPGRSSSWSMPDVRLLLPGNERPHPGRAPRHRGHHRHRPRRAAIADRRRPARSA